MSDRSMMITRGDTVVRVIQCNFCAEWKCGAEEFTCPYYGEKTLQACCEHFVRCEDMSRHLESLLV